ncbi:MAG: hypothetical protein AB1798_01130 [Spirochaetota bacterium]
MPVRSLNSSVLVWPKKDDIQTSIKRRAVKTGEQTNEVSRIGYFGSYARNDWGVGSDLETVWVYTRG